MKKKPISEPLNLDDFKFECCPNMKKEEYFGFEKKNLKNYLLKKRRWQTGKKNVFLIVYSSFPSL